MLKNFVSKLQFKSGNINSKPVVIAFLGDSVTQGCFEIYKTDEKTINTVFDSDSSYSAKLKKILGFLYPRVAINIINAGVSGGNAAAGLDRLDRDVLSYNPDMAVVCFGLNDCCGGPEKAENYKQALKSIFKRLKENNIDCIFLTPNIMNDRVSPSFTNDKLCSEIAEKFKSVQSEGTFDLYIEKAKEAAEEENVLVSDCYSKWKRLQACGVDTTGLLANHLNHPSRDMHWLFAFALAEKILFE